MFFFLKNQTFKILVFQYFRMIEVISVYIVQHLVQKIVSGIYVYISAPLS